MAIQRPWWCQDPTCTPANNTPYSSDAQRFELSGFCAGLLTKPRIIERHGYVHTNDMHLCFRSAVRGVVMLEVNEADLQNVSRAAMHAMVVKNPDEVFNLRWYTGRPSDARERQ